MPVKKVHNGEHWWWWLMNIGDGDGDGDGIHDQDHLI